MASESTQQLAGTGVPPGPVGAAREAPRCEVTPPCHTDHDRECQASSPSVPATRSFPRKGLRWEKDVQECPVMGLLGRTPAWGAFPRTLVFMIGRRGAQRQGSSRPGVPGLRP